MTLKTTEEERKQFRIWLSSPVADIAPTAKATAQKFVEDHDALATENERLRGDLARIRTIYKSWEDGDEPEGAPSPRRTLIAIGECLAESTR